MSTPVVEDTQIVPGEGLGSILKLGHSLFEVITELNRANYRLQINYSDNAAEYSRRPIQVELVEYGIRLTFNHQVLELVEVSLGSEPPQKPFRVVYNGLTLNDVDTYDAGESPPASVSASASASDASDTLAPSPPRRQAHQRATLKQIYNKIFGPTYPGDLTNKGQSYVLSYPGVALRFSVGSMIPKSARQNKMDSHQLLQLLLNHQSDVVCEGLAVFSKNGRWNALEKLENRAARCDVDLDSGKVVVTRVSDTPVTITIGETTQQQVVEMLGPPDDYFNKYDSRMQIHGTPAPPGTTHKFHNYFRWGLDVLYEIGAMKTAPTVLKIVLHNGGITESLAFGRWNGCEWQISSRHLDAPLTSEMLHDDLPKVIRDSPPVLLDRTESEFVDRDVDIVEVVPTSSVFGHDSVDDKIGTWGQSKLYGFHRSIVEVMNANGCVSSVTVF
ncbi:hypothetical protein DIURU_000870 [Diutina rugosa]|uniref:Uncharacterized protein n=1 Tax=Diutina rugosa TaxID=5481 RepID=A0A642UXA4_DIURU|nr:uncharacterized protein DIURU_000870 [Diutina rugosa]KAA8907186.1 hypothetical protein DIURU_000870 [Diutina rugosa]